MPEIEVAHQVVGPDGAFTVKEQHVEFFQEVPTRGDHVVLADGEYYFVRRRVMRSGETGSAAVMLLVVHSREMS